MDLKRKFSLTMIISLILSIMISPVANAAMFPPPEITANREFDNVTTNVISLHVGESVTLTADVVDRDEFSCIWMNNEEEIMGNNGINLEIAVEQLGSHEYKAKQYVTDWGPNSASSVSNIITIIGIPCSITLNGSPTTATLHQNYSYQLNTTSCINPIKYTLKEGVLPNGITLSEDGLFSGSPTQTGNFNFKVEAKAGTAQPSGVSHTTSTISELSINVIDNPAPIPPGGGSVSTCCLTFETNGGSKVDSLVERAGSVISLTQMTKKKDYNFMGWYSDKGLTEKVTLIQLDCDTTVYAGWQPIEEKPIEEKPIEEKPIAELNKNDHFAYIVGYPDGRVCSEHSITRAEVAAIFYRLLVDKSAGMVSTSYSDVKPESWYTRDLSVLSSRNIFKGYEDGSFRPESPITRAEFAAVACRFDNLSIGTKHFTDISSSHWAYNDISSAAEKGWVSGYPDGSFKPEQNITRAEVAKIVNAVLERSADQNAVNTYSWIKHFPDLKKTHWSYYDIMEAANTHDYVKTGSAEKWVDKK